MAELAGNGGASGEWRSWEWGRGLLRQTPPGYTVKQPWQPAPPGRNEFDGASITASFLKMPS